VLAGTSLGCCALLAPSLLPTLQLPATHTLLVASMGEYWLSDTPDEALLLNARGSVVSVAATAAAGGRRSSGGGSGGSADDSKAPPAPAPTQVFVPTEHKLVYRFVLAPPLRGVTLASLSFLDAPFGTAAIAFMHVCGIQSLLAWDVEVTRAALATLTSVVRAQLLPYSGYLVELSDGLVLASFSHPHVAIRWALATVQHCMAADWPQELLHHEVGGGVEDAGC
jgi:hypothetical protein